MSKTTTNGFAWSNAEQSKVEKCLNQIVSAPVRKNVDLSQFSRWKIGGKARFLVMPSSIEEVSTLLSFLNDNSLPFALIGETSNILFDSRNIDIILIKIGNRLSKLHIQGTSILAEAGVMVPALVRAAAQAGLAGITHAAGIPGTLGGLVVMNGGTQRKGIGERVDRVWVVDNFGRMRIFGKHELQFSYRDSMLRRNKFSLLKVELQLEEGDKNALLEEVDVILEERRKKFPEELPNCGSTFLSDPSMYEIVGPPGRAIEEAGLKGLKKGDAQISPLHANFIVNNGNATDNDVLWLIARIRSIVAERTGHFMDCEVLHMSPDGELAPAHEVAMRRWADHEYRRGNNA